MVFTFKKLVCQRSSSLTGYVDNNLTGDEDYKKLASLQAYASSEL